MDRKLKILIAEDDILLRDIWGQKITKAGFDVLTAANGVEAMTNIELEKPDILLLDIVMPKMDGFSVLEKVRKSNNEKIKKMIVIILSNLSSEDDIKKAKELGSDGYMVKAMFSTEDIISKVKEYKNRIED